MLWSQIQRFKEFGSLLFCIGFSLGSLIWNGSATSRFIYKANNLNSFFISTLESFNYFVKGIFTSIKTNEMLRRERDSYQKIVEEYKNLPYDLEVLRKENEALRKELGFQYKSKYPTLRAEVLSLRLNSIYRTIVISKGKKDGVKVLMPVIAQSVTESGEVLPAVVGKIISVEESTSLVQPIINSNFSMGAQIPDTNFWAILSGNSGRSLLAVLSYIDSSIIIDPKQSKEIGPEVFAYDKPNFGVLGMMVYSSGEGLFPPNLPIGKIVEEGARSGYFKTAYVAPLVNFAELKYVIIIQKQPEKWYDIWPEDNNFIVDTEFYGELDFPEDEKEKSVTVPKQEDKKKEPPKKNEVSKPKETETKNKKASNDTKKGNKTLVEEDEEFLIKKTKGDED